MCEKFPNAESVPPSKNSSSAGERNFVKIFGEKFAAAAKRFGDSLCAVAEQVPHHEPTFAALAVGDVQVVHVHACCLVRLDLAPLSQQHTAIKLNSIYKKLHGHFLDPEMRNVTFLHPGHSKRCVPVRSPNVGTLWSG